MVSEKGDRTLDIFENDRYTETEPKNADVASDRHSNSCLCCFFRLFPAASEGGDTDGTANAYGASGRAG